jgi:predicted Zn finger-like uncharacterized protein
MALATRCPHCQTTFRVVHDQLKLRAGMVRCGNCQQIFNGIEHLIRANTPAAPASPPLPPILADVPNTAPPPIILAKPPLPEIIPEVQPIVAEQAIIMEQAIVVTQPIVEPEPLPVASVSPPPEPVVAPIWQDETPTPASTAPIIENGFPSEILPTSKIEPQLNEGPWEHTPQELATAMAEPRLEDESPTAPATPEHASGEMDEPSFVKAGRRQQKWRRVWSLLQATACILLITLLLGQSIYTWRDIIVLRWPASKIMILNACTILHCKVGLPTRIHAISIELGELQVLPRNKNTYSYSTALRNQSNLVQAWPHIELILTDGNDIDVARRVFTPADYLSNYAAISKGFAPQSDHPVKLYFEFLQLKAANYRAEIFYP